MKHCAVICEYNPFHNGHKYQLQRIRELTDCDGIICVMSGDFVQRAEPAFLNKYARCKCALLNGADLVTELPVVYAVANAEKFAYGAIEIVTSLPRAEYLAMGCETSDPSMLFKLADIQFEESDKFKQILKTSLDSGLSYAHSYSEATAKIAEETGSDINMSRIILQKPNNVLCLEYIKALKRKNSNIKVLLIPRVDSYSTAAQTLKTASSSKIRESIEKSGKLSEAEAYIPDSTIAELIYALTVNPPNKQTYSDIAMYALHTASPEYLKSLPDIGEGIENKISTALKRTRNIDRLLEAIKSKRYTAARLKRTILQCVLGITDSVMSDITKGYSHILGVKKEFKSYFSLLPQGFYITANERRAMSESERICVAMEKKATALYGLLTHDENYNYSHDIITV